MSGTDEWKLHAPLEVHNDTTPGYNAVAPTVLNATAVSSLINTLTNQMRATGEHLAAVLAEALGARDKIVGDAPLAPTFFSIEELARRWDVNIKTIREAIRLGQVPVVRIGKKVLRIPRAAVEKLETHPQGCAVLPGGRHGSTAR